MIKPRSDLLPNTADYENLPLVTANGFREYDARWLFGKEINLLGIQALGLGLGTYLHDIGVTPRVVTGHDFRSYSLSIKQALTIGLMRAGCEVHDIGLALSPVAYFAQFALDVPAVAMVTASHNPPSYNGLKIKIDGRAALDFDLARGFTLDDCAGEDAILDVGDIETCDETFDPAIAAVGAQFRQKRRRLHEPAFERMLEGPG